MVWTDMDPNIAGDGAQSGLEGRRIVVGVTGGIAAYKAAELCSQLQKEGATVRVAMSRSSAQFVTSLTFEALTQHPVYGETFGAADSWQMEHITWAKWADLLVIAPASADFLARMAAGFGDDPLALIYLSFSGPVVVAPAMNSNMLAHPATQANLITLRNRQVTIVAPDSGPLACGDIGPGRLASPDVIVSHMIHRLSKGPKLHSDSQQAARHRPMPAEPPSLPRDKSLAGISVLITSGPTHEYIDPARFIMNVSSGRAGAALAREAARRGAAAVHLVTGPVEETNLPAEEGVTVHRVVTAGQMHDVVMGLAGDIDLFLFAAAVSDFRVAQQVDQKIKRSGNSISLRLTENPDIAQAVGHVKRPDQITVGFIADTEDVESQAVAKLSRKRLNAIIAGDTEEVSEPSGDRTHDLTAYYTDGRRHQISGKTIPEIAHGIAEAVRPLLQEAKASAVR